MLNTQLTQIARNKVSKPTRWLLENGYIQPGVILHHGCGKAQMDTRALMQRGVVIEYDPNHSLIAYRARPQMRFNTAVSNYVLNVLPPVKRNIVINELKQWAATVFVTVRGAGDKSIKGTPFEDGVITNRSTFQKGFSTIEVAMLGEILLDTPTMKIVKLR